MDRKAFFDAVRRDPFGGALTQSQVDGLGRLLSAWEASGHADRRWLAYILATAFHETGRRMQPVEEVGGSRRPYGRPDPVTGQRYYGRGDVQLTHKANYEKASQLVGIDLVARPERALEPDVSARILIEGMVRGLFTGRRLADYLGPAATDWVGARRVVNGLDRAASVAAHARAFHAAIERARAPAPVPAAAPPDAARVPRPSTRPASPLAARLVLAILAALASLATYLGVK